jgi:vacuolar-type H+-ATPase subunit D/Vma8
MYTNRWSFERMLNEHRTATKGVKKKREALVQYVTRAVHEAEASARAHNDRVIEARVSAQMGPTAMTMMAAVFNGDDNSLKRAVAREALKWAAAVCYEGTFAVDNQGTRYQ